MLTVAARSSMTGSAGRSSRETRMPSVSPMSVKECLEPRARTLLARATTLWSSTMLLGRSRLDAM